MVASDLLVRPFQGSLAWLVRNAQRVVTAGRHAFVTAIIMSFFAPKNGNPKPTQKHSVDPALQPWVEK
jgi:hypothetical protein